MTRKGGGRETGAGHPRPESGEARIESESAQGHGQSDSAAANPRAAERPANPAAQQFCPEKGLQCALRYEERIRALESELAALRRDRDATAKERNDIEELAIKAEARVKELEERIEALHAEANAREISISNLKARVVRFEECDDERKATVKECERLRTRVKELEDVIRSALGEIGDFPPRPEGGPPFWWRDWLQEKARLSTVGKRSCACDQECGCCEEE